MRQKTVCIQVLYGRNPQWAGRTKMNLIKILRRLHESVGALLRPLATIMVLLMSVTQAWAISEGCAAINRDWNGIKSWQAIMYDGRSQKLFDETDRISFDLTVHTWTGLNGLFQIVSAQPADEIFVRFEQVAFIGGGPDTVISGADFIGKLIVITIVPPNDFFYVTVTCLSSGTPPVITGNPSDSAISVGANTAFTVSASNATSYTWQLDTGSGFDDLSNGDVYSGASSETLTITGATAGMTGYQYRAIATGPTSPAATSHAATLTVNAPTITVLPGTLASLTVGKAYSQTMAASGGTAPYTYAATSGSLPAGLTLDASTGLFSGTPTAAGTANVTVTATDAYGATGSIAYSIAVAAAPVVSFSFSPEAGHLPQAMAGEDYSQPISASGGTTPLIYSLSSGSLPNGMVLNASTGELRGPIDADAEVKDYTFTIQVRDNNGAVGSATFSLEVVQRAVTVTHKQLKVPTGATPTNVDLTKDATGGPFVQADIVSVEPAHAGTVSIVNGEFAQAGPVGPLGWYLKFTPNPAYSGHAHIRFRLSSALGISNTGIVTYHLGHDPGAVAAEIDTLVHGFVQTRQGLIASTIGVPGLIERRQMASSVDPVTARMSPSASGITTTFSTSLVQMEAASNKADGITGAEISPFNVWIDGTFMLHNRAQNDNRWGSFGVVSLGADYLLSDKALIGLSFHYDRMTDPTDADAELTGNGLLVGPYASFEIGKGVFWDTSLLYGGSSNMIDTTIWDGSFDTRRWLFDTSIKGQWQLDDVTTLTPKLRAVYFSETVNDYAVENGKGDVLDIGGFTAEQLRVSLGAEVARQFMLENGTTLTPKIGVTAGFAGLDGTGAFGQVSAGMSVQTIDAWKLDLGLLFNIGGYGEKSAGARAGISKQF